MPRALLIDPDAKHVVPAMLPGQNLIEEWKAVLEAENVDGRYLAPGAILIVDMDGRGRAGDAWAWTHMPDFVIAGPGLIVHFDDKGEMIDTPTSAEELQTAIIWRSVRFGGLKQHLEMVDGAPSLISAPIWIEQEPPVPEQVVDESECWVVTKGGPGYLAYEWRFGPGGGGQTGKQATGTTLEVVRQMLPEGLHRFERQPGDDDRIVETWL